MASNEGDVAAAPVKLGPNLSDLPIELQLLVLRKCLVAPTALFNFGFSRKKKYLIPPPFPDAVGEFFGQDELCVAILFTCRLYNEERWKILFSENSFSFNVKLSRWQQMVDSDVSGLHCLAYFASCWCQDIFLVSLAQRRNVRCRGLS